MELFKNQNIDCLLELIIKIGCLTKEMLKIKLYPPFSLIILGILSRLYAIFNYIQEYQTKIIIQVDENLNVILDLNN